MVSDCIESKYVISYLGKVGYYIIKKKKKYMFLLRYFKAIPTLRALKVLMINFNRK